jgi:glycerol-3-phosphate dehydrogenase
MEPADGGPGLVARDTSLAEPIVAGLPTRAEVVEAVEREWAVTLEDVLRRRTHVALRAGDAAAGVADEVAGLMAAPLGWTDETRRTAAAGYAERERARRRWR